MPVRVAVIGAGSIGFTRGIVRDILCVPEFRDIEFAFTDINEHNLDMVFKLCTRDIEAAGLPAKITATRNRREAVADAKYVLSVVRVGGLRVRERLSRSGGGSVYRLAGRKSTIGTVKEGR